MPTTWWATELEEKLSQGDVIKQLLVGASPHKPTYLQKGTDSHGKRVWEEIQDWKGDNTGLGNFLAQGRIVPCIVLSHDCTIENDGERARVLIAPMYPWSNLNDQKPEFKRAVLEQRNRSFLPLTNVPGLDGDFYADLRSITYVDRRSLGARIASMSIMGLERLQDQIADFFVRIKIDDDRLASTRKEEQKKKAG